MASRKRLFGTDGIRGQANRYPMDAETAVRVGRAVAVCFRGASTAAPVLVGRDTRKSGPMLESALVAGICSAGVDVFCADETVLSACNDARAVVFQVMGAHNLSNRYYTVHPRRNDRFLKASALMRNQFPEIDFTEFHFTRHLLTALRKDND